MLILLAGMVAEAQFTGQYCAVGATQDLRAVRRLAESRSGNPRQVERVERRALDKAEYILDDTQHLGSGSSNCQTIARTSNHQRPSRATSLRTSRERVTILMLRSITLRRYQNPTR